jgi:hypothetical protein
MRAFSNSLISADKTTTVTQAALDEVIQLHTKRHPSQKSSYLQVITRSCSESVKFNTHFDIIGFDIAPP